jgi:hypothetical protein
MPRQSAKVYPELHQSLMATRIEHDRWRRIQPCLQSNLRPVAGNAPHLLSLILQDC